MAFSAHGCEAACVSLGVTHGACCLSVCVGGKGVRLLCVSCLLEVC